MRGPLPAGALGARRAFDVSPALRHSLGAPQNPSFPPLNLHKAASAAITAGFLHVAVSKARTHYVPLSASCPLALPIQPRTYRGLRQMLGKIRSQSLQFCVFRLGLLQDGDVRVGVFPECEEILIRRLGFGVVSGEYVSAAKAQ